MSSYPNKPEQRLLVSRVLGTTRRQLEMSSEVIGVIPEALKAIEHPPSNLTELRTVDSMHKRKLTMFELAEGFVALPGGLGTLDELFEMLTWGQLGIHDYPCRVLNVNDYYDGLQGHFDHAVSEGFIPENHRDLFVVDDDPAALIDAFDSYDPPSINNKPDVRTA